MSLKDNYYANFALGGNRQGKQYRLGRAKKGTLTPEQKASLTVRYKKEVKRLDPPPVPPAKPTPQQDARAKLERSYAMELGEKQQVVDAMSQPSTLQVPFISPVIDRVKKAVGKTMGKQGHSEDAIYGTLAAGALAIPLGGTLLYQNHKSKEAEKEKQAEAQVLRDRAHEVIARRSMIREARMSQLRAAPELEIPQPRVTEQSESRIPYNFFKAAPLVASANFGIGFRSPVYIKAKEKALPAAVIGGGLLAGYGLLSNLNKQRAVDALRINKLKNKDDKAFASNYYDSPQYYADNLIREAASITGNPLLDSIPNNDPLDQLGQKKKPQAKYSRVPKTANFFDPITMSAISLGSAGYGIYNKRRAANEQSEVYEAQKLAALDTIKDKNLRRALINKARGQTIDEETKNQMVDSALNGDIKGLLGTGLKNINW